MSRRRYNYQEDDDTDLSMLILMHIFLPIWGPIYAAYLIFKAVAYGITLLLSPFIVNTYSDETNNKENDYNKKRKHLWKEYEDTYRKNNQSRLDRKAEAYYDYHADAYALADVLAEERNKKLLEQQHKEIEHKRSEYNNDLEDLYYLADTAETNEDREEVEWQVEMARDKLNSMKNGLSSYDYNEYQAELDDITDIADESVEDINKFDDL